MKKILIVLSMLLIAMQMKGENKYFPEGTTWIEVTHRAFSDIHWDTTTYVVKGEVIMNDVAYNEVLANGERYCLIREEGPLVYIWKEGYYNGLLYDFDWWEGKEYLACDFLGEYDIFRQTITNIEEKVLEDGETYQTWTPEDFYGFIICGVGGTNSILNYWWPLADNGVTWWLLEFTRNGQVIYRDKDYVGMKSVGEDTRETTRPIRLKKNDIGGFELQIRNGDGTWKMVK
jgi:hypothetical protein